MPELVMQPATGTSGGWTTNGIATFSLGEQQVIHATLDEHIAMQKQKLGIKNPTLKVDWYFKLLKKKFNVLENATFDRRIKRIEELWSEAVDNGQDGLAARLLRKISEETKKSIAYAKGYRNYVLKEDIWKHKSNINGGHISDTEFSKYTEFIPKSVLAKKKEVDGIFDKFVILHYYNNEIEKKLEKKEKLTDSERSAKRDPILFGIIDESPEEWFFIDDWETDDDKLTLDDLIDADVEINKITKTPDLTINK